MSKQDREVTKQNGDDDADFAPLLELGRQIVQLQEQAKREYQPNVDDIIRSGCRDAHKGP